MTDEENQESTDVEIRDPLETKMSGVKNQECNDSLPCDICGIRRGIKKTSADSTVRVLSLSRLCPVSVCCLESVRIICPISFCLEEFCPPSGFKKNKAVRWLSVRSDKDETELSGVSLSSSANVWYQIELRKSRSSLTDKIDFETLVSPCDCSETTFCPPLLFCSLVFIVWSVVNICRKIKTKVCQMCNVCASRMRSEDFTASVPTLSEVK